jgi:flagellar basal-body rod protein FlgC
MPNVNVMEEMADMIVATRAYEANITAAQAAKSMALKSLELGR